MEDQEEFKRLSKQAHALIANAETKVNSNTSEWDFRLGETLKPFREELLSLGKTTEDIDRRVMSLCFKLFLKNHPIAADVLFNSISPMILKDQEAGRFDQYLDTRLATYEYSRFNMDKVLAELPRAKENIRAGDESRQIEKELAVSGKSGLRKTVFSTFEFAEKELNRQVARSITGKSYHENEIRSACVNVALAAAVAGVQLDTSFLRLYTSLYRRHGG